MPCLTDCTLPEALLGQIAEQGPGILPELVRITNTAMLAVEVDD